MSKNRNNQRARRPRPINSRPRPQSYSINIKRRDNPLVAKRSLPESVALRSARKAPTLELSSSHRQEFLPDPFGQAILATISSPLPRVLKVCARRQQRREVLHALKKTGKSGNQKRPRYTDNSLISC